VPHPGGVRQNARERAYIKAFDERADFERCVETKMLNAHIAEGRVEWGSSRSPPLQSAGRRILEREGRDGFVRFVPTPEGQHGAGMSRRMAPHRVTDNPVVRYSRGRPR